jgi:hypothetical protein
MMELELKKLTDTISSIHEEMFYLRARYTFYLKNTKKGYLLYFPTKFGTYRKTYY